MLTQSAKYRLRELTIAIRTGDTSQGERAQIRRTPPDILITTPESLFLILTSASRKILASGDTVIIEEIHSMVLTKRGSLLFVSLERLEMLRNDRAPLQRIDLSATQRPVEEIAWLLGGGKVLLPDAQWKARDVEIVDAGSKKNFDLRIEVAREDMAKLSEVEEIPSGPGARHSIWPTMYPRLVEMIRENQSTMIVVNSRRRAQMAAIPCAKPCQMARWFV